METPQAWLQHVPRGAAGLPAWLEAGRPLYPDAATMGNAIKDASRDAQFSDLDLAEWLGRALILFGEQEKAEGLIGLGEIALGDAIRLQNKTVEGLALLDRAAERFERIGDEMGWARTRIGWLGDIFRLEDHLPVEPVVTRAMQVFERANEPAYLVPLLQNYANYCIVLGRLADALPLCEQALAIVEAIPDVPARTVPLISILNVMVQSHYEVGHYRQAEAYVHRGMAMLDANASRNNLEVEFLCTVCQFYLRTGRFTQCLYTFEQARRFALRTDHKFRLETCAAQAYLHLNRLTESEEILKNTLETLSRDPAHSFQRAVTTHQLAEAYRLSERWDEALRHSTEALELMTERKAPSVSWLHVIVRQQAMLLDQLGERDRAQRAIAAALNLADEVGEHAEQISTRLLASRLMVDEVAAWQALNEADEMARSLPWLRWRVNQSIARLTDDAAVRRHALVRATEDLDTVQSSLSASFHADYLTEAQNLYEELMLDYLASGEVECAWQTIERAKSRALLNSIMMQQEASTAADSPLLAELKQLQLRHFELTRQIADGRVTSDAALPLLDEVESRIARTRERMEIEQWGRREPLGVPSPFIPVAPAGTDLLGYYVAEDAVHVLVHNGERYYHEKVEIDLADLRGFVVAIMTNGATAAAAPDALVDVLLRQVQGYLATLFSFLIAPVRAYLRHPSLVIVPHGVLHQVPFHLLWDSTDYLLQSCEIRIVPTARLLERDTVRVGRPVRHAVISHDWDGRLPNVARESAVIANLLGTASRAHGAEARKERVLEWLGSRGVLHIAAHGAHRTDNPELSHVQLEDGQLSLVDLFNHTVHKDLVTLSACETGQIVIRAGDDPVGLWRGFLAAGTRSLLVALWQIEDSIALQLMTGFYARLAAGAHRVSALRAVQREWLAHARGRYLHPFYWGAYQLIGDDGPLSSNPDME